MHQTTVYSLLAKESNKTVDLFVNWLYSNRSLFDALEDSKRVLVLYHARDSHGGMCGGWEYEESIRFTSKGLFVGSEHCGGSNDDYKTQWCIDTAVLFEKGRAIVDLSKDNVADSLIGRLGKVPFSRALEKLHFRRIFDGYGLYNALRDSIANQLGVESADLPSLDSIFDKPK
jgi:hypothetical protein